MLVQDAIGLFFIFYFLTVALFMLFFILKVRGRGD